MNAEEEEDNREVGDENKLEAKEKKRKNMEMIHQVIEQIRIRRGEKDFEYNFRNRDSIAEK